MKSLPNYTWSEWLASCKIAQETEGQRESFVHEYLIRCEKNPSMDWMQIAVSAWRLYQYEKTGNAQ
jgi:hypothetical protein